MQKVEELPNNLTPERLPKALFDTPYFFLLESSRRGPSGRWSIAAFDPIEILEITDDSKDPFQFLQDHLQQNSVSDDLGLPFAGGWIGYLGYELYSQLEKKVPPRKPDLIPKAVFCLYDTFYLYDHLKGRAFVCGRGGTAWLQVKGQPRGVAPARASSLPKSNFTKKNYIAAIKKIKNYIAAGDCYQVNLSQRFSCKVLQDSHTLYQRLRTASPAPYAAYLNLGEAQVLSSSPECFLSVDGAHVVTRPIKGTRPRGETQEKDRRLREELVRSEKDHAELLMITDLERNDLGRVCRPGSITVADLHRIESYAQVHHQVTTIEGELASGRDVIDLLKATFPGGSITGAPKIRAMQIIHELEPDPRNVYCGAIGYIGQNGKAQFNIAIRTMILKDGETTFWGGGGIVADSNPEEEYQETLDKVKGMREACSEIHSGNNL